MTATCTDPRLWHARAQAYISLDQWDKAVADLDKCLELDGACVAAWSERGSIFSRLGQWDNVIRDCSRAIQLKPDALEAYSHRARAYAELSRWDKALADFGKIEELQGNSADAKNTLAWLLANCPEVRYRDPHRAVELAKKAVALAPKVGRFHNTLGVAHYRAGNWSAAIKELEESNKLRKGGNSFDWFFLAMAHWRLDQKDEGLNWYKQAVEWLEKNGQSRPRKAREELTRFRAEAKELLMVKE